MNGTYSPVPGANATFNGTTQYTNGTDYIAWYEETWRIESGVNAADNLLYSSGNSPATSFPLTGWVALGAASAPAPTFSSSGRAYTPNQGLTVAGLSGGAVNVSNVTTSGTITTAMLSRAVASGETGGTLSGVAGAFMDSASPANPCAAFSIPLTNQSTPAPTNLTATGGLTQVSLAWTGIAGNATYSVYRSTSTGTETLYRSGLSGTSFTDTGLTGGTYFYKVSATLSGSESTLSNEASATASDFTLSASPATLTVQAGGSTTSAITLTPLGGFSGTASLTGSYTAYGITTAATGVGTGSPASFNISTANVTPPGTYSMVVTGIAYSGTGTASHTTIIKVIVTPPLPAPTALTATPGNAQVILSWTAPPGTITGYNVKRSLTTGGPYSLVTNVTAASYTDTSVSNRTQYYYVVSAVNASGEGLNSAEAGAMPGVPDDAVMVSQTALPSPMTPGQTASVTVVMKNVGTNTWSAGDPYYLGGDNPLGTSNWAGLVTAPTATAPGQTATFTFPVTAPSTPGTYNFQRHMVHGGLAWFGTATTNQSIVVGKPDDAQFVSQSPPPSVIRAGMTYSVSVTMKNVGTNTWTTGGAYTLTPYVHSDPTWQQSATVVPAATAPGQSVTITFTVTAPAAPGSYHFQWQMLHQGVNWFGDPTGLVTCTNPADDAQFVSSTFPATLTVGQSCPGTLTMKNVGTSTWTDAASAMNGDNLNIPQNDPNIWGVGGALFPARGQSVAPGQSVTFGFTVTAPTSAGTYPLRYQMLHQNTGWFGDISPTRITVAPPPAPVIGLQIGDWQPKPALINQTITAPVTASVTANPYQSPTGDSISQHWAWATGGVYGSADGSPGSFTPATNYVIGWDQGSAATQFRGSFSNPGYYIVQVTATLTYHDDTTGQDVCTASSSGYIGGSVSDLASSGSSAASASVASANVLSANVLSAHQALQPRSTGTMTVDGMAVVIPTLTLSAPNPLGRPDQGDGTNQFVYDNIVPNTAPNDKGHLFVDGIVQAPGATSDQLTWLLNPSPKLDCIFDAPMTTASGSPAQHTWTMNGSNLQVQTSNATDSRVATTHNQFIFFGLPASNSGFGNHQETLTLQSSAVAGQTANIQTFFMSSASNYPGAYTDYQNSVPTGGNPTLRYWTPNWYHYYRQIYPTAGSGYSVSYDGNTSEGGYDQAFSPFSIYIGSSTYPYMQMRVFALDKTNPADQTKKVTYIGYLDCPRLLGYIAVCAHEHGHQAAFQASVPPATDPIYTIDPNSQSAWPATGDGDEVVDAWENKHHMDSTTSDTTRAYGLTSNGRLPGGDVPDNEVIADIPALAELYNNISLSKQDWAGGGTLADGTTPAVGGLQWGTPSSFPDIYLIFHPVASTAPNTTTGQWSYGTPYATSLVSDIKIPAVFPNAAGMVVLTALP